MNRDTLAPGDEADDRVGRRRLAAAREPRHQPIDTDDEYAAAPRAGLALARDDLRLCRRRFRVRRLRDRLDGRMHLPRVDVVARVCREELVQLAEARLRRDRVELQRRLAMAREIALLRLTPSTYCPRALPRALD